MKKFILLMMLVPGITSHCFAQTKTEKDVFEIPANALTHHFWFNLDKGNVVEIDVSTRAMLAYMENTDSIISAFMTDWVNLNDSIKNDPTPRKVVYLIGQNGINTIRIQRRVTHQETFAFVNGEAAALKFGQDTLQIIIKKELPEKTGATSKTEYARIRFVINNLNDMVNYQDVSIAERIAKIKKSDRNSWYYKPVVGSYLKSDPTIHAFHPLGLVKREKYMLVHISVDVQNYKNNFIPSLTAGLIYVSEKSKSRREFGFYSENHFSFQRDAAGTVKTYRNRFVTFSYEVHNDKPQLLNSLYFSLSYLVKREGTTFDKNTFRLGIGQYWFARGTARLEPILYFNDALKNVTPGLRLVKRF